MKYKFIKENSNNFTIDIMCDVFEVSRSGYYFWKDRPLSNRSSANKVLLEEIKRVFYDSKKIYGGRKVYKQLKNEGVACSKYRVASLMQKNNLTSKTKKKFKATTNSKNNLPVAENISDRQFKAFLRLLKVS